MHANWSSLPRFGVASGLALIIGGVIWAVVGPPSGSAAGPVFALSLPGLFLAMNSTAYIRCAQLSRSNRSAWSAFLAVLNGVALLVLATPFLVYLLNLSIPPALEQQLNFLPGPLGLPVAVGFAYKFLDLFLRARRDTAQAH